MTAQPDGRARRPVLLSVEQALSMPYATLRFVHLGWRVIRVEPAGAATAPARGDPNRYVGPAVADGGRHAYFVAPNAGKEAIALNLAVEEGRALLHRLVAALRADVFCTNTLPSHHEALGIDYETLRRIREGIVWCSISALGPEWPDVRGYDPVMQALCGYMDLTGSSDGPPLQCGIPIVDLRAGDEAFAQILLALLERAGGGPGRRIDVSMGQAAASWLLTVLPMLELGIPAEALRRSGNEHRQFVPVNAYRTRDGFLFLAVGSDVQWTRLVGQPAFAALAQPAFATNEGRRAARAALHAKIAAIAAAHTTGALQAVLDGAGVPNGPITPLERVAGLPFVAAAALSTVTPDGRVVRLPPPATGTPFLEESGRTLRFAPAYGEHTTAVLAEAGLSAEEIASLRTRGAAA